MSSPQKVLKLARPPIIEAVIDIDCDLLPDQQISSLEPSIRSAFRGEYPKYRPLVLEEHQIETKGLAGPIVSHRRVVQALQFLHADEKQLVQVRAQGFSFNRLAPYSTLDDYLPQIQQGWNRYCEIAAPVQVRAIRLRYINRILLPGTDGRFEPRQYLRIDPRVADDEKLAFLGFFHQHAAREVETGHEVNIVLASQPGDQSELPVILDITAAAHERAEPADWDRLLSRIQSLRNLKNRIFRNTLTEQCLNLFQH